MLFHRKDGYAYNYAPLDWKGQSSEGQIYIGGIFSRNVDIRQVHVTHRQDPVSTTGEQRSLCIEFWDKGAWHEYPEGTVHLHNIYEISYYEEKKLRERKDMREAVQASCFGPQAPVTDSSVEYLTDRSLLEGRDMWRITCEDNAHWAWDVRSVRFIGQDNEYVRPLQALSSGHFDSHLSANQAVYGLGNIWAGHKDSTGIFYIGCKFEEDLLPSHVEISQPLAMNMRNVLYVEYWDSLAGQWVRMARYFFHSHFLKRGPISLSIMKRYELPFLDSISHAVPFGESSLREDLSSR